MSGEMIVDHLKKVICHEISCEEEIAKLLEEGAKYYEDDIANKILNTKKYKSRVEAPKQEAAPSKPKATPKEVEAPTTLTNGHTTASQAKVDIDKLSHHDAIAYLAKKLLMRFR